MSETETQPLDALVIAAHPDDAELGAAGAILSLAAQGMRVGILDLTDGEPTPFGDPQTRQQETDAATRVLGVDWRENLGLPNRSLEPSLEARAALANVFRRTRPRWLFAPYWTDAHPDHVAANKLVDDARFWSKLSKSALEGEPYHPQRIFNYFSIHLKMTIDPDFVLDISDFWPQKSAAIACYQSQFVTGRQQSPSLLKQFENAAAYWGQQIGCAFGEPYACRETLGLRSLKELA